MIFLEVITLHERKPILILPTSPESVPQENEVVTKPLHTLTHVCKYWRDVALGNPALWRHIHSRCHDQMKVFLECSQSLNVTLFLAVVHWDVPEDGPVSAPMESLVKAHAARLCRLDLSMVPARPNISLVLASIQARHLEVLTSIASPCMYHTSSELSGALMTQELLLNGETSPLKALAIMPIVDWMPSCTPFPHLTHLFISFDAEPGLGHPFGVLELLSNTAVLAYFHVDLLIVDAPNPGNWHPPPDGIPLSRLRSLVFTTCSYNHIYTILSRLSLPKDVFIRLQGTGGHIDVETDGHPAPLPPIALRPATSLDISTEHDQFRVVADGPTSGLWLDGRYDASDEPDPAGWERWLLQLHKSIILSHVTHLHIHLRPLSVFLDELLGQLPQLSRLAVLLGESAEPDDNDDNDDNVPQDVSSLIFPMVMLCTALSPSATASGNPTETATTLASSGA